MEKGIIFCSISEAVREHPDLVGDVKSVWRLPVRIPEKVIRAEKLQKLDFSKFQFCPARGDISEMQPVVFMDWCDSNTEA